MGGTNGWFPDGAGDKPWLNGALSALRFKGIDDDLDQSPFADAMQQFAQAQDQWSATWPESDEDRAMIV